MNSSWEKLICSSVLHLFIVSYAEPRTESAPTSLGGRLPPATAASSVNINQVLKPIFITVFKSQSLASRDQINFTAARHTERSREKISSSVGLGIEILYRKAWARSFRSSGCSQ